MSKKLQGLRKLDVLFNCFEQSRMRWGASAMAASATLAVGLSRPGAWKPDQSVAFEEFGHLGRGRSLAGELFDAESLKDQAQRALMLIQRLGLEIWFAIGADNHRGHLTS